MELYKKLKSAMRFRLIGAVSVDRSYLVALDAFDHVEKLFEGKFRKDGTTPMFLHPLEVMAYLTTMQPSLRFPVESFAAALLHDAMEDSGLTVRECSERYGERITHAVRRLSKVIEGAKVQSLGKYFEDMLDCPIATVVKGADRVNNQGTMVGVFTEAKQLEYVEETETYILPMLKAARRLYADQEPVYENLKLVLRNQVLLVRAMHG